MKTLISTWTSIAAAMCLVAVEGIASGWDFEDCNGNGIPDSRELRDNDCNGNGVPDECDPDSDGDGTPDGCDRGGTDLDCSEFDRYEVLTPNDTLTVVTNFHNPQLEQGYLVVSAADEEGDRIGFDHLIGNSLMLHGLEVFDYSINPVDYRAIVADGEKTDLDFDGIADLNGIEYEKTAGQILIPRFLGQAPGRSRGELLLIALSGGRKFSTIVDLLVYNDNEVMFSAEHGFRCWDRVPLLSISQAFSNTWLADFSGDDAGESIQGFETGWIRIDGGMATSRVTSVVDPAVYAVYIERVFGNAVADLPFEYDLQRGHLLPDSLWGDDEENGGGDQVNGVYIGRRKPGSLLLYPEFDNRQGIVSMLTVTNTHPEQEVRVHFSYIGRFGN